MKQIKRYGSLAVCVCLLICTILAPQVQATSVAAGVTITAGAATAAPVVLAILGTIVVFGGFASWLNQEARLRNMTVGDFLLDQLQRQADALGTSVETFISALSDGVRIGSDGKFLVPAAQAQGYVGVVNQMLADSVILDQTAAPKYWISNSFEVSTTDNGGYSGMRKVVNLGPSFTLNIYGSSGGSRDYTCESVSGTDVFILPLPLYSMYVQFYSADSFTVKSGDRTYTPSYSAGYGYTTSVDFGYKMNMYASPYKISGIASDGSAYVVNQSEMSTGSYDRTPYKILIADLLPTVDQGIYGSSSSWLVNKTINSISGLGTGQGIWVDPKLDTTGTTGNVSVNAGDYSDVVDRTLSGYGSTTIGDDVISTPSASPTITVVDDLAAVQAGTIAAVGTADPGNPGGGGGDVGDIPYGFDWTRVFPFCIPFDLVAIWQKFDVEPQAPAAEYRFYVPGLIDYTLDLDLSVFDPLAEVLRTVELIALIFGLALATRKIIWS